MMYVNDLFNDYSYEGFAQLTNFMREEERYNFTASFVLHNESLIMGNL
jgi:hypothetical protein